MEETPHIVKIRDSIWGIYSIWSYLKPQGWNTPKCNHRCLRKKRS